jgi:putative heme-binding domain-containing protein
MKRLPSTITPLEQLPEAKLRSTAGIARTVVPVVIVMFLTVPFLTVPFLTVPFLIAQRAVAEETINYTVADPDLTLVRLDRSEKESFLAVHLDATGRMFVGGREALFVYEPNGQGGYHARQELYRFPAHVWMYDIKVRGHDLYVLTGNALYVLPDAVVRRKEIEAKKLIWGIPRWTSDLGFHGMEWGPEGDLYICFADPSLFYSDFSRPDHRSHWTFFSQPDGTKTPYTGVGGVLRCRPDGSQLRIVVGGTKNNCGIAFDHHWNLFGSDNDHEPIPSLYSPLRLMHLAPQTHFGWPRGWMAEKSPDRADLLETVCDSLGRGAPVGMAYYDDAYLPSRYRNNLLLGRWGRRAVGRYPLTPDGASFRAEEQFLLQCRGDARPVCAAVGRGGRIFVTVSYMSQYEGDPSYVSDLVMITRADDSSMHPFDAYDPTAADEAKLWRELANPSWSRRQRAHVELLRRGGTIHEEAVRRLGRANPRAADFVHLIWLAAASRSPESTSHLTKLATHSDPMVRCQVIRSLTEYRHHDVLQKVCSQALADANPQVRLAAVQSFFNSDVDVPDQVALGPARSKDTFLRQAATLLLARRASSDQLAALCDAKDAATRLSGVLAVGFRLTMPLPSEPVPESLPIDPSYGLVNGDWTFGVRYADTWADLRTFGRVGSSTTAQHWKAAEHSPEQERLFHLLLKRLKDSDELVRLQAAHFLHVLNDPRSEPAVAKVRTKRDDDRLARATFGSITKVWLAGPFPDGVRGLDEMHPPEAGAIDLASHYKVPGGTIAWKEFKVGGGYLTYYNFYSEFGPNDHASFYAYFRLESGVRQPVNLFVGSNDGVKVWHNGQLIWKNAITRGALPLQDSIRLHLQPGSNDFLVRIQNVTGDYGMYLAYQSLSDVVVSLPENLGLGTLAERLKKAATSGADTKIPSELLDVDWQQAVAEGNPQQGRKLFGADALACVKCHAITADQVGGGPSLAESRQRFTTAHLVESILLPSEKISPLFRSTTVTTHQGEVLSGLVVRDTDKSIEILLPDASRKTISKNDIDERKMQDISPMPPGLVKSRDELRDILAYLLSKNPRAP